MNLEQLKEAFKNRNKIFEGLRNKMWKQEHIETIAQERLTICQSNKCGYYDPLGQSERAVFKGVESCGACGCRLDLKTRALSANCGLEAVDKVPMWFALTNEQDDELIRNQIQRNEI